MTTTNQFPFSASTVYLIERRGLPFPTPRVHKNIFHDLSPHLGSILPFLGLTPGPLGSSLVSAMTSASSGGDTALPVAASVDRAFMRRE